MPLPKEGCFQVTHPSTAWVEVPCIRPPEVPYIPARGRAPETVGNGTDNSSEVSGTISWAEGSFPSVSGVTSETDGTSNNYSLQLNSNNFTQTSAPAGPSCSGALTPSELPGVAAVHLLVGRFWRVHQLHGRSALRIHAILASRLWQDMSDGVEHVRERRVDQLLAEQHQRRGGSCRAHHRSGQPGAYGH